MMKRHCRKRTLAATLFLTMGAAVEGFAPPRASRSTVVPTLGAHSQQKQQSWGSPLPIQSLQQPSAGHTSLASLQEFGKTCSHWCMAGLLSLAVVLAPGQSAFAENELSAKYGGGLDTSLVDQTCLVDRCGTQAKACLADDPSCRKGLTCTAKCLGDNSCITGCMARYGNEKLDNFLKCTIEDEECIKVAILPGGADPYGSEPKAPGPVVKNFQLASLQGPWYKVIGYNPNYDCYACQRNTFSAPQVSTSNKGNPFAKATELTVNVEFSMPHRLPDGSPPPPPGGIRESIILDTTSSKASSAQDDILLAQSVGLNDYQTRETMVFDSPSSSAAPLLTLNQGTADEVNYARTAHSEGEMFGLKFWENWYILGENAPESNEEFKFVYFNGKTRQNTYEGAFVYSRSKELSPESMQRVYEIAKGANMNVDQFCRIRNGCFDDSQNSNKGPGSAIPGTTSNPFRGILASTKVSELLGVEPVAAQDTLRRNIPTAKELTPAADTADRAWWYEVGDYLENPHRHFETMDRLRQPVEWPQQKAESPSP